MSILGEVTDKMREKCIGENCLVYKDRSCAYRSSGYAEKIDRDATAVPIEEGDDCLFPEMLAINLEKETVNLGKMVNWDE